LISDGLLGLPHHAGIGRFKDILRGLLPVPEAQENPAMIEKPVDDRSGREAKTC